MFCVEHHSHMMRMGRSFLGFALIGLVGFGVTVFLVPDSPDAIENPERFRAEGQSGAEAPIEPSPSDLGELSGEPESATTHGVVDEGLRGYALPLAELRGLSPDSSVGSRLEIWVAWHRDVGGGPQVQRVVRGAVLGAVREATVAEGPLTVELFIPLEEFPDFLSAYEFGSLSAALIP